MVVIEMENGKKIKVELDPASAPISCENFEKLVREGFYNGLTFHRIIKGFMIQGAARREPEPAVPGTPSKVNFLQTASITPSVMCAASFPWRGLQIRTAQAVSSLSSMKTRRTLTDSMLRLPRRRRHGRC